MYWIKCSFVVICFIKLTMGVKVNMHGQLSLGKEVMDTLTHYLVKGNVLNSRRASGLNPNILKEYGDYLYIVKSAKLCKNLDFCSNRFKNFVNKYIATLIKAVNAIFSNVITNKADEVKGPLVNKVFDDQVKLCLELIRKVLKKANKKVAEHKGYTVWIEVIKRISAIFQESTLVFVADSLVSDLKDDNQKAASTQLNHKLIVTIIYIEDQYERNLCHELNLCSLSARVTDVLHKFLTDLINASDTKVKDFMTNFYEELSKCTFYSLLNEVTAHEFQKILHDAAYDTEVPIKDILRALRDSVKTRLDNIGTKTVIYNEEDVILINIILSDLDHHYSKKKDDLFAEFLIPFSGWLIDRSGKKKIGSDLKHLLKDISKQLNSKSQDLLMKLSNEVKMFLELTIDPE